MSSVQRARGRAKRYSYTPRRKGETVTRVGKPSRALPLPLIGVFAALAAIIGIGLLTKDSADLTALSACASPPCGDEAVALGATSTPRVIDSAAQPQTTPVYAPYATPQITGLSAMILEEPCGVPVYGLNEDASYPPASLTKLMTALVAARSASLDAVITSPLDGVALSFETNGTVMGVELGEKLTLRDLLYGMLLRSGNDAALVIADYVGGSEEGFVDMMNDEAEALGLTDTHFANPHGLDDSQLYVSAHDIAIIGHEVLQIPELAEIVATVSYTPDWDKGPLENINLFLTNYPGAIGLKTGFTDTANQTIVAASTRGGRTLLVSVLYSGANYDDAIALLDWAFASTTPAC